MDKSCELVSSRDDSECGIDKPVSTQQTQGEQLREARHRRREILKLIAAYKSLLLELTSEREILEFEESKVKQLDWEVRDFVKYVQDTEGLGKTFELGGGVGLEFESLVTLCKARAEELAEPRDYDAVKPPSVQLGRSSRSVTTRRSKLSAACIEEIIEDELELAKLKIDAESAIKKKQAEIQAKYRKQKSLRDDFSDLSSRVGSRKSRDSERSRTYCEIRQKYNFANISEPGMHSGAADQTRRWHGTYNFDRGSVSKMDSPNLASLAIGCKDDAGRSAKRDVGLEDGSHISASPKISPNIRMVQAEVENKNAEGHFSDCIRGRPEFNLRPVNYERGAQKTIRGEGTVVRADRYHANISPESFERKVAEPHVESGRHDVRDISRSIEVNPPSNFNSTRVNGGNHLGISRSVRAAPAQTGAESTEMLSSRKDFLDEAILIAYDGTNMPFIMFYNQITNLMDRCPFPDRKLHLLRAACVRAAAHTISVVISDTPGFDDACKIDMALNRLSQRFGVRGGFTNEPEVQKIRNGLKMTSTTAAAWKAFKDEITQCFVFAHSYKKPEQLEGRFVVDLARRLPNYAKQRYLDFLNDRYGTTGDPTFASLQDFVVREENSKSTEFGVLLMEGDNNEKAGRLKAKQVLPSVNVKKTSAAFSGDRRNHEVGSAENNHVMSHKRPVTENRVNSALPLCFVCDRNDQNNVHNIFSCSKFRNMTPVERKDMVFRAGRCFNCLKQHFVRDCRESCVCRKCKYADVTKHSYMLHECFAANLSREIVVARSNRETVHTNKSESPTFPVRGVRVGASKAALNRIVAARLMNPTNGRTRDVYCQLDGGSQLTFVSNKLAEDLQLEPYELASFNIETQTLTGKRLTHAGLVKLDVQSFYSDEIFRLENVVTHEPWRDDIGTLPHNQDLSAYAHFQDIAQKELPDRDCVDLLVGNDNAFLMTVLQEREGTNRNDPHAVLTKLGWLSCGGYSPLHKSDVQVCRVQVSQNDVDALERELEPYRKRIYELEKALRDCALDDLEVDYSRKDKEARKFVEENLCVRQSRYEIPVPLKTGVEKLKNNLASAHKRVEMVRRKALKNEDLETFLVKSFQELKELKYIEKVSVNVATETPVWYLPYFVTCQVKKRIVYDGKAEWKGMCINNFIDTGPDLLNSLSDILARFRLGKFGMMADLTKCFFQIQLPKNQRDLFRLLWFSNDDISKGELEEWRFTRHPWGIKSSPFIASFAILKTLEENTTGASELTCDVVRKNIYMDDLIFAVDDLEKARSIATEAVELFRSRGFELVKWSSNREALPVLREFDREALATGMRSLDLSLEGSEELPDTKALGCVWETESDRLRIVSSLKPLEIYTRRSMLSQIGKSFEPLGIFSPFFVKARLILQRLAIDNMSWDQEASETVVKEWKTWFNVLDSLLNISLPRHYFANALPVQPKDTVVYELHGFSDASNCAYGSVVYVRRLVNGLPTVSIVFGRSKVVLRHQQTWSIARKELTAAVTTVELTRQASRALNLPLCEQYFWCDSKNVLQWIKNKELRLDKFISRRIDKINLLSEEENWNYCPTDKNPADVASRPDGVRKAEARDLWFFGPKFLYQDGEMSTIQTIKVNRITSKEKREDEMPFLEEGKLDELIQAAPSLYTLKKRVAYLSAFVEYLQCKAKKKKFDRPKLDASDLERALCAVVQYVQKKFYGRALKLMKDDSAESFAEVVKKLDSSKKECKPWLKELRSLNKFRPCVDSAGLLRIEGRLSNSLALTHEMKHPLILPSKSALTRLIVLYYHTNNYHIGVQHTLLYTRSKFWIVNGHAAVKRYLSECNWCALDKAKPVRQLMSDLPSSRTSIPDKPFSACGLDYLGPINYVEGRSSKKAWGLLFTCMASRAIHVEIVTSLSLKDFLLALSRFNDVRGRIDVVYSDNGSTFQAAAKKLPLLLNDPRLKNSLREKGIRWEFIPPYAPAQGGTWEAMVKQFKLILLRILENASHKPNLIELITFCSNAVRIVNERPLTLLSDDPRDQTAITPASLLSPGFDTHCPIGMPHDRDHLRRDYRFNIALADQFWRDWIAFYLPTLQGRNKWRETVKNLQVGQAVLVGGYDEIHRRGNYRLGRIAEVFPQNYHGKPLVRRAKIAVSAYDPASNSCKIDYIIRDISRIAPID